jgi:hypothetical protein
MTHERQSDGSAKVEFDLSSTHSSTTTFSYKLSADVADTTTQLGATTSPFTRSALAGWRS